MATSIIWACRPLGGYARRRPHVVVYAFTAGFVRWLLELRRRVRWAFSDQPVFTSVSLRLPAGRWLWRRDLAKLPKLSAGWVELPGLNQPPTTCSEPQLVSDGWTVCLSFEDLCFQFYERHDPRELTTPPLSEPQLVALLERLAAQEATVTRDLWELETHYGETLALSDPDHEDFADSGAEVVEHLWQRAELARRLLGQPQDVGGTHCSPVAARK